LAVVQAPQVDSGVIIRGLKRYWWCILSLWVGISVPVAWFIYKTVEPTYEATSRIRIEPTQPNLYDPMHSNIAPDLRGYEPYLQTQVNQMLSNQVLGRALSNESIASLPLIAGSQDPETDLREKLVVEIEPNTYFIKVALESPRASEAAAIVNAVVATYQDENDKYNLSRDAQLKASLTEQVSKLRDQIDKKVAELKELHQRAALQIHKPSLNLGPPKDDDDEIRPTVQIQDQQQINTMIAQMVQIDLDLLTAEANLKSMFDSQNRHQDTDLKASPSELELEDRVKEAFYNDPDVAALSKEIKKFEDEVDHQKHLARKGTDRARQAAQGELAKLMKEWSELWESKSADLRKRLRMGTGERSPQEAIASLQRMIEVLKGKKAAFAKLYEKQQVEQKTTNDDSFKFAYAQQELNSLLSREDQVKRNLAQVEFQSRQEAYRVVVVDKARVPKVPSNNKRFKYMTVAPLGAMFLVIGIFLLMEIKAARVANPDVLETRVRSEVYGLPRLPTSRELRRRNEPMVDDQIEQFSQRLDHLRFAICGNSIQTGRGRCVLITSAVGGEGKTTLAAHLAARCGNAGMSTLLIDADLQKGALPRLLDVPDGLGLSDVIEGGAAIEDAAIPVQGGTFRLLCAGTPTRDNSVLLQDRGLETLIAQLRQIYDLIIIDSPPVLPIPDALILGRWVDGAVLAARYDISRFPQVERARRQLDNAGIPVLGTVINGMRGSNSYYGKYKYSRRRSPETDSSNES
jgi:capsular exopolysaccharide synthesis family protein